MKGIVGKTLNNPVIQHLLFWALSYYVLLIYFSQFDDIRKIDYIYTGIFHFSLIAGVYLNLIFLIPKFLSKKRYMLYIALLILNILFVSELNEITFKYLTDFIFPGYYFISYYSFADIMKFHVVYIGLTTLLKLSKGWFELIESRNKLMQIKKEFAENELKALKSQINPHFLFNNLNSIYSLALKRSEKTPEIILKLSDILRYMLYEVNETYVPLKKEVAFITNYIELQKLRTDRQYNINFQVSGNPGDQKIAPLVLIPLIENSFKHGLKAEIQKGFVDIKILIEKEYFIMEAKNNKGTVDDVEKEQYKGIGLENVKRRLDLIYPGNYQLDIRDGEEEYFIKLRITLS